MNEVPRITIGYSTLASRVENILFPSLSFPHSILISVQNPGSSRFTIPRSLTNVSVVESKETGVTKSRNKVVENTSTDYLIFADDDATIDAEGLATIISYLDSHPACDLVTAITTNESGLARKRYAIREENLTLFNSAKVGTIEMVLRVASAKSRRLHFDENFGAGSANPLGDEYIFISDLLKSGGQAVFLPVVLASHPDESSGANTEGVENSHTLTARAKVFTRVFGWKSPFVRAYFYLRRERKGRTFPEFIRFVRG
ncbi:MAG: glycosyltransferase [Actinobacteria bacterium]|nr:glycosyltransferase [Actinomycetota bacterium]